MSTLRLVHISDLHFSSGAAQGSKHCHDIALLKKAQERIKMLEPHYLIVSGDISNDGDRESLLRARDWVLGQFSVGSGEVTGLSFPADKVLVVPGNHDVNDDDGLGSPLDRWQRSLFAYNFAFSEYPMREPGCYYEWLTNDDSRVFLAVVDSSYMGDLDRKSGFGPSPRGTAQGKKHGRATIPQKSARGKLLMEQSESLVQWHDAGVRGKLARPHCRTGVIPALEFRRSLKVLLMHHYLFQPPGYDDNYFLDIGDRDNVVRNIVLADYDVVLCGHKHVHSFDPRPCGTLFDSRAKKRYLLNCLRRAVGLHSHPLQFSDSHGRKVARAICWFVELLRRKRLSGEDPKRLIDELVRATETPSLFNSRVAEVLRAKVDGPTSFNLQELSDLEAHICTTTTVAERQRLARSLRPHLSRALRRLSDRPLLQVMAGSTTKAFHEHSPPRSLNCYEIETLAGNSHFKMARYVWNQDESSFELALTQSLEFAQNRRADVLQPQTTGSLGPLSPQPSPQGKEAVLGEYPAGEHITAGSDRARRPSGRQPPVNLFFSYSRKDELLRRELEKHLALLKREGMIRAWHDHAVGPGEEWAGAISEHLESAQIILLLISADFIDSNYCYDMELRRALERHDAGTACVIPIILKACDWRSAPFARLNALPRGGAPVNVGSGTEMNESFADIACEIRSTVQRLSSVP